MQTPALHDPHEQQSLHQLVLCSWLATGFLIILSPIIMTSQLDFCASNKLNHYYCDYGPLT